jgi:cell division protein FtsB
VLTLVVAAIVGVTLSVLFGHDGIARLLELRAEQQRLGEEAVALLQANASLRDQVKRLESDDRYLETLARRDLGLVRPNETVYRFRRKARPAADR